MTSSPQDQIDTVDESRNQPRPWWGTFSLEESTGGCWRIGPLTLWVYRTSRDWRIVYRPSTDPVTADPMAERSEVTLPVEEDDMTSVLEGQEDDLVTHRYSVRHTKESLALSPALADRPVVSRPEHPISILPKESVTLYLSTPLWARVELPESDRLLQEVPSHRMSDTWFGSSTREGSLCYAMRTAGRLRLDRLPIRLHRALTPLRVRNRARDTLNLERVQLPVPHLSLYRTENDVLWTEAVTMTRQEGETGATVRIVDGAPPDVEEASRVQEPREKTRQGLFTSTFSAFGALFGP